MNPRLSSFSRPACSAILAVGMALVWGGGSVVQAQMVPNAPVVNFSYPRFAENGYTQWVLRGERAIYDSEEQIRVEGMGLRLYTGDERMAVELTLRSPFATLRTRENRAFSDDTIAIEGQRFELSGRGWEWTGADRRVQVRENAAVSFEDTLPDALAGQAPGTEDGAPASAEAEFNSTRILSESLLLEMTDKEHRFEFVKDVDLRSRDLLLRSGYLLALADAPVGRELTAVEPVVSTGSLRYALAREAVEIEQFERLAKAGEAEFFPGENRVELRGLPNISLPGAYVAGSTISLREGNARIAGADGEGRAQLILTQTGGLGLAGASALASETIALADLIVLTEDANENFFNFEGNVEVLSGGLRMVADQLSVFTTRVPLTGGVADEVAPATVQRLIATGNVRIEQDGQIAEGQQVEFFPEEERALLTGNPRVFTADAEVRGGRIEMQPGQATARRGEGVEMVTVTLPQLPDLGYTGGVAVSASAEPDGINSAPTVIRSHSARMDSADAETRFTFVGEVEVEATNLSLTAGSMLVLTTPQARDASVGGAAERLDVERIDAFDEVVIAQGERRASADRASFLPRDGRTVLEGNAVVQEADGGRVTGGRMTLLQGQRRAIVEGGADGERARITLPALPEGFR